MAFARSQMVLLFEKGGGGDGEREGRVWGGQGKVEGVCVSEEGGGRSIRFSKILSDFCSLRHKHLICMLKKWKKYQFLKKNSQKHYKRYNFKTKLLKNSIFYICSKIAQFVSRQILLPGLYIHAKWGGWDFGSKSQRKFLKIESP